MTELLLVRHAHCDHVGTRLVGTMPGVALSKTGIAQAQALARELANERITAVYSSPLERAMQTAAAIAAPRRLAVVPRPAFTDIDFGEWTGATFDALKDDPRWRDFNERRSETRAPDGEHMRDVQQRAAGDVRELASLHAGQRIVIVTHADIIRAILCVVHDVPLDALLQFEVEPASVTRVLWSAETSRRIGGEPEISGNC